jgi:hypothetical protein
MGRSPIIASVHYPLPPNPEMGVEPDGRHGPENRIVDVRADGPPAPPATEELTSMPLSPHEEPLSAYEEKILAALEEEFRVEDPALDGPLSRTPPSSSITPAFPLPIRHVLYLLAALTGLIAVVAFTAAQLGILGMAVVTCAAVGPWLVWTARSAERRSHAEATSGTPAAMDARKQVTSAWGTLPTAIQYSIALLAVILFLVALALMPPSWRAILGVLFWLVVLPLGLLRLSTRWTSSTPRQGTPPPDPTTTT